MTTELEGLATFVASVTMEIRVSALQLEKILILGFFKTRRSDVASLFSFWGGGQGAAGASRHESPQEK